jgi:hypothetical protein
VAHGGGAVPWVDPALVDAWLSELGVEPLERAERDDIVSWDLVLDGRARHDVRVTLILDPALVLLAWAHFAPPLNDSFRVSYRRFLRWNDELPFVKFALSEDDRPVLTVEIPATALDRDALGAGLARLLAVCDLLLPESVQWLWPGRKTPPATSRPSRHEHLLSRFGPLLGDLDPYARGADGKALPDSGLPGDARAGASVEPS